MINGVKVVLHKKKRANGEYPVMLRFNNSGKVSYISIGATSLLKDWDEKREVPRKSHPHYEDLVKKIAEAKQKAGTEKLTGQVTDVRATLERAVSKVKDTGAVLIYFDQTIARLKAEGRHGYAATFQDTRNRLGKQLLKNKEADFGHITPQFLRKWESQLKQDGLMPGAISLYFRTLSVLFGYARLEKLTSLNPFKGEDGFSLAKYRNIKTAKRAISKDSIDRIRLYKSVEYSPEYHTQQLFMFSYYTRGTNFTGLAYLTPDKRQGNYLLYQRKKTHQWQRVYLVEPARQIWDWYVASMKPQDTHVFWFILGPKNVTGMKRLHLERRKELTTPEQIQTRIDTVLKQMNRILRVIAKEANVVQHMTTYVARHSFASGLKALGVPTDQISELLGHDSVETTRIYLESFDDDTLNEAVERLI